MRLRAVAFCEYPPGVHWTPGEVRDVDVTGEALPAELVEDCPDAAVPVADAEPAAVTGEP